MAPSAAAKEPASHDVHPAEPAATAARPAAQSLQSVCPICATNVPASHSAHEVLPTAGCTRPAAHCWQAVIFASAAAEPARHAVHTCSPVPGSVVWNAPLAQSTHPDFVGDAARVPAAHVKQMRSVVAVGLADSYVPAGHVVTALHCRSDFCVGGMLS